MRNDGAIWRNFSIPGVVWLVLFVVVPAYAVLAVSMGQINSLLQPVPQWNPIDWNVGFVKEAFTSVVPGGTYWPATRNTITYVVATVVLCFAIGYPVAYYVARHAGRSKGLLLLLIFLPFWVSYLMRMLAWIGLVPPAPPGPRPTRQAPARRPAGPRPHPDPQLPPRHPAAELAEHPRRLGADRPADVRRLLHQRPDLGIAAHQHARQQRQPAGPGRFAEEPRRGVGAGADDDPRDRDALLPLGDQTPAGEVGVVRAGKGHRA